MTHVLKIARVVCGAGLVLASVFWVVILVRLIGGLAAGGLDGARGNVHQLMLEGALWVRLDPDPVTAISRGYETVVLCLVLTWALREVFALAGRSK